MKKQLVRRQLSLAFLGGVLCLAIPRLGVANDETRPSVEFSQRRTTIHISPEYVMMSLDGRSLSGIAFGFGIGYAVNSQWGVGFTLRQAMSLENSLTSLFTEFQFSVTYALTGGLIVENEAVLIGDQAVYRSKNRNLGGWRLTGSFNEVLFNGSSNVIPYAGLGLNARYVFPSQNNYNIGLGLGIDRLSNGETALYPLHFVTTIEFML